METARVYLLSCISGLQTVVRGFLTEDLPGAEVLYESDGFITFAAGQPRQRMKSLPYANNVFEVIRQSSAVAPQEADQAIAELLADDEAAARLPDSTVPREKTFRCMMTRSNRHQPLSARQLELLEGWVGSHTRLRVNRHRADTEYWLIERRDGPSFFAKRLTRRGKTEKDLAKGELRPELCSVMCRMSEPSADDVFADPFCGSGAIPLYRARSPFGLIFACDVDAEKVRHVKQAARALSARYRRAKKRFIAFQGDARELSRFDDGFVTRIVTDPPWGLAGSLPADASAFYQSVLAELARILKAGGLLVLLAARNDVVKRALSEIPHALTVQQKWDILVAGKQASLFKIARVPS